MMRRLGWWLLPTLCIIALLVAALWLAADAESAESQLGAAYGWLFGASAVAVAVLVAAIARALWRLAREHRAARPGSRLNLRLALLLGFIALPPTLLVSAFAMRFLEVGIDSWFRVDLEAAHHAARDLGAKVLQREERLTMARLNALANEISVDPLADIQSHLDRILEAEPDLEANLVSFDSAGNLEAQAFSTSVITQPPQPDEALRLQVREAGRIVQTLTLADVLVVRALVTFTDQNGVSHLLQWIEPLPPEFAPQLTLLEGSAIDYAQLRFQRDALKTSYVLILGFVTLLALLASLLAALAATRRMTRPIAMLAQATAVIGEGRFGEQIPLGSSDELGALTGAFNRMSRDLAELDAREQASRGESEQARAHLAAVLSRLSAGVISIDGEAVLTANSAAAELLSCSPDALSAQSFDVASQASAAAQQFIALLRGKLTEARSEWREELRVPGRTPAEAPRALLLRAVRLAEQTKRYVVIIDDMTLIAQAQRESAWAEVARRLAHEIKNPLTPIRLAAERMQHRFQGKLDAADAQVLERATQTIVAQVDALKGLVNAFGDYAHPPRTELRALKFDALLNEVLDLYEASDQCRITRQIDAGLPSLRGDCERLRQLLINLLTNAVEAGGHGVAIDIQLQRSRDGLELVVRDHGPGLPEAFDGHWFEPYMSSKPKGGGLGLAMVQKIAEEHGGRIVAENVVEGGARFVLWLPLADADVGVS